jgi:hypothetical protein
MNPSTKERQKKMSTANTVKETEDNRAEQQARGQLASIVKMALALQSAKDDEERENAETAIHEDALSVQVRGGWHSPGEDAPAEEFEILLCTGGPACRIIGDLDEHMEPSRPRLQYQDWGTPWTEIFCLTDGERDALAAYCQAFYFGE